MDLKRHFKDLSIGETNTPEFKAAADDLLTRMHDFNTIPKTMHALERKSGMERVIQEKSEVDHRHISHLIDEGYLEANEYVGYRLTKTGTKRALELLRNKNRLS